MKNQIYASTDVKQTSDKTVQVSRSFKGPRALVYRAFTEPTLLKQWMLGPPGWEMPVCQMDLKVGGEYVWRWKNKSTHKEFGFFGTYREVVTAQKLKNTQTFDPGTMGGDMGRECVLTATFSEADGHTTVTTTIEYLSAKDMELALGTNMTAGMEMSYRGLDELLKKTV